MAVFDVEQQRMCVRVVYDGAASAGKTTNLQQLAELFASQRTCELFSPAEMDGRTLYFDWLQIAAGMVCGFPLVCQVISVPGQVALTPRRRYLLSTADVVVHVCDSDEQAAARASDGLALFDELERERGEKVPLVIQANKQDQRGAVPGAALFAALERTAVPVVEAIASDGIGVIDTFVAAVRGAVRSIQARVDAGHVRIALQSAETSASVLHKLTAVELDPEWEVEMFLEEASNAFMVGDEVANRDASSDPVSSDTMTTWGPEPDAVGPVPALPTEHVPTGFIWPAHTGRAALRALAGEPEMRTAVTLDRSGAARLVLRDFVLSTGRSLRFEGEDAARQALVRAARERTQLGALLAPETVLVAQPSGDGTSWLWTILPRVVSVAELLSSRERADVPWSTVLSSFGAALADALKIECAHGMALTLSPGTFGVRQGITRYLGEIATDARDARRAVAEAFSTLAAACDDIEPALSALEAAMASKLTSDDLARLTLASADPTDALPPLPSDARQRLAHAFARGRRAA